MKGVILAAGKGSRLFPITHHIPKPLLPMANRITMSYAFERLKEMGITDICIVVGENEPIMREALGDGSSCGVNLSFVRQLEPKGLAHALGFAKDWLGQDQFVLYLGDAVYSHPFNVFLEKFLNTGCDQLTICKTVPDPERFGVAEVADDRITKLVEKPKNPTTNLALAGLYFFGPKIWEVLPDLVPSARGEYEITDAIQLMVDRGFVVRPGLYEETWFDTGTLDSFLDTSRFLTENGIAIAPGGQVEGLVGAHTVVGENASVQCVGIDDSVVFPGSDVRVTGKISHSILAGNITVEGDVVGQILYGE